MSLFADGRRVAGNGIADAGITVVRTPAHASRAGPTTRHLIDQAPTMVGRSLASRTRRRRGSAGAQSGLGAVARQWNEGVAAWWRAVAR